MLGIKKTVTFANLTENIFPRLARPKLGVKRPYTEFYALFSYIFNFQNLAIKLNFFRRIWFSRKFRTFGRENKKYQTANIKFGTYFGLTSLLEKSFWPDWHIWRFCNFPILTIMSKKVHLKFNDYRNKLRCNIHRIGDLQKVFQFHAFLYIWIV